jgi:2-polyprenyl-3-methyl-5-hydroxy-6-metoxy-1,4-benzoquinol methylase
VSDQRTAGPGATDFRERLYAKYVSGHQGVLDASRRNPTFTRDVIRRMPSDRAARVLEVGCGQGDLIALLRASGWTDVKGIDISEEQVQTARQRGVDNVVQADLFEFAEGHQGLHDVVIAMDVVEHFDRSQTLALFHALRLLLTPGGCLIIQTPNGASPFSGRIFWSDVTHGMQFTSRSLDQVCSAVGFATVTSFPQRPAVHGIVSAMRACIWRVVEGFLWLATAAETSQTRHLVLTQNLVAVARAPRGD